MNKFILVTTLCSFFLTGCCTVRNRAYEAVDVCSSPSGALITVDGEPKGVTPQTVNLARKYSHEIVLEKEGFQPQSYTLQPKASAKNLSSNALFPLGFGLAGLGTGLAITSGTMGGLAGGIVISSTGYGFALGLLVGGIGTLIDLSSGKAKELFPRGIHSDLAPVNSPAQP